MQLQYSDFQTCAVTGKMSQETATHREWHRTTTAESNTSTINRKGFTYQRKRSSVPTLGSRRQHPHPSEFRKAHGHGSKPCIFTSFDAVPSLQGPYTPGMLVAQRSQGQQNSPIVGEGYAGALSSESVDPLYNRKGRLHI